jgi:Xaa-Pro aminopeptidase
MELVWKFMSSAPQHFHLAKETLQDGIIHTVERGFICRGKGGVRIEDDVLVNGQHPETLSKLPKKDLLVL